MTYQPLSNCPQWPLRPLTETPQVPRKKIRGPLEIDPTARPISSSVIIRARPTQTRAPAPHHAQGRRGVPNHPLADDTQAPPQAPHDTGRIAYKSLKLNAAHTHRTVPHQWWIYCSPSEPPCLYQYLGAADAPYPAYLR